MNELGVNHLDLYKHLQWLSIDDFMCLLFGYKPGTIKFDYGDPKDWPEHADIIYKLLSADILAKKLDVVFDDPHRDPRGYEFFSESYEQPGNPWWEDGKLHKHQLVEWLAEKKIPSEFFGTAHPHTVIAKQASSVEQTEQTLAQHAVTEGKLLKTDEGSAADTAETTTTDAPARVKKKYRPRCAITAAAAAAFLGVTTRQVQNWDKGKHRPDGYPGRADETLFQLFVTRWNQRKQMLAQARAMNRAVSGGGVAEDAAKDAFDDL